MIDAKGNTILQMSIKKINYFKNKNKQTKQHQNKETKPTKPD